MVTKNGSKKPIKRGRKGRRKEKERGVFFGSNVITRKIKKVIRSNRATILKRNAMPRRSPAEKSIRYFVRRFFSRSFFASVILYRRNPAVMIGKRMKFSALAIFPSKIGVAKSSTKNIVVTILMRSFLKSICERKKNIIMVSSPTRREASLTLN